MSLSSNSFIELSPCLSSHLSVSSQLQQLITPCTSCFNNFKMLVNFLTMCYCSHLLGTLQGLCCLCISSLCLAKLFLSFKIQPSQSFSKAFFNLGTASFSLSHLLYPFNKSEKFLYETVSFCFNDCTLYCSHLHL